MRINKNMRRDANKKRELDKKREHNARQMMVISVLSRIGKPYLNSLVNFISIVSQKDVLSRRKRLWIKKASITLDWTWEHRL